jgi:hypothetical protein
MTQMEAVFAGPEPDVERASEIFAEHLDAIGAYSNADVDHLADAWEITHGRPLWRDTHEPYEAFLARAANHKPVIEAKKYFMDRNSAGERLTRLREVENPSETMQAEINDLEELLDEPRTNFKNRKAVTKPQANKVSRDRYLRIQAEDQPDKTKKRQKRSWQDRLVLVQAETDLGALQLVSTQDDNEAVRTAALARIASIEVTGR